MTWLSNKLVRIGLIVLVMTALFTAGWCSHQPETQTLIKEVQGPTIYVDKPRDVVRYVPTEDRKQVEALLKENETLKLKVNVLSVVTAMTPIDLPPTKGVVVITTPPNDTVPHTTFNDWRLHFDSDGKTAQYSLNQKFTILNTVAKDEKNQIVSTTKLYEVGPGTTKTLIPNTENTVIAVDPTVAHFYVQGGVQGGWTWMRNGDTGAAAPQAFAVAVPWLKHGSSIAPADTRWAFLTPAATYSKMEKSAGVMPLSLNVATLPGLRKPFTDIWVSPYLGTTTGKSLNRLGLMITFTF